MASAGAVAIQSARLSQIGLNRQVLKEGSSVLVRVIADRGNGKYEGSVAGVRVQLNSAKPLKPGDSFISTVSVKDGTIVITPKETGAAASLTGQIALSFNEVSQAQLFSLLESLGLPADNLSASILKTFKQMGLQIDSGLINKIRTLALRFGGKEKSAAELLSLLVQKDLSADEEEIKALLVLLQGEEDKPSDKHHDSSQEGEKLLNKINKTEGAWYLLPFELVQLEGSESLGQGCIRLLYDSAKTLKQLNLECRYNSKKYLFKLSYEGKKITNTYFNVSDLSAGEPSTVNTEEESLKLKKRFMAAGINPGKIEWAEKEDLEGSASGLESFVTFGGQV